MNLICHDMVLNNIIILKVTSICRHIFKSSFGVLYIITGTKFCYYQKCDNNIHDVVCIILQELDFCANPQKYQRLVPENNSRLMV